MTLPLSLDQYGFMTTRSGLRVNPWNPDPNNLLIQDIAHALSHLCRFTGHTARFYSVAEHSIIMSRHVAPEFAFEALMHDAAEAYINDLSRPLKKHPNLTGYSEVDHIMDGAIRKKWNLPEKMSPAVKEADNLIVVTEGIQLMENNKSWTDGHPHYDITLPCWYPANARENFMKRYVELSEARTHQTA